MYQLKIRTEYSFKKTYAPIKKVVEHLKESGCKAAGIVDFESTWGHVEWHKTCRAAGIKPILGIEIVVSNDDTPNRMWFLAKNKSGLKELYNLVSLAHHQKISTKWEQSPRLFLADVENMSDNILKFAGDVVNRPFLASVGAFLDLSPKSVVLNHKKKQLAKDNSDLLTVETSDNYYAKPEDFSIFEIVADRGVMVSKQHILSADEFDYSSAEKIADMCEDYDLDTAPMVRMEGDLEALCRTGIIERKMAWNDEYEERLQRELEVIATKDFTSYFLIVADMVRYAKEHMLVGPSRGSAAGSLVCYLTRITEVDPIPPKLFFERFIDISRSDLPDIDLDFPDTKRHLVFEYMNEKYGKKNTAHIGTIMRYKPKSALTRICKVLNIPPYEINNIKENMIVRSLADARANDCLLDTLESTDPGKVFVEKYPHVKSACQIEGHAVNVGVHAAGLLVCNDEITNYCVVDADGIAHLDKTIADQIGLLKIDVLGLRTLSVLEDSGVDIDWYNLPHDDPATIEIFKQRKLCGIFQFEGNAMRSITEQMQVGNLNDIDAVTALARPGPFGGGVTGMYVSRRNGEPYESIHPIVAKHMDDTHGLPVYQEQTMAIVREIGLFDWDQTSNIRKAMSKRLGMEYFESFWNIFKVGAAKQGIEEATARKTWDLVNSMGAWQMNKAHTRSYAIISYWCAYLKAHHLLEFTASTLRNAKDEDSSLLMLKEFVKEGGTYVSFDIDKSEIDWSVKDGALYGGFKCLKGIGDKKAEKLIEKRNAGTLTDKDREVCTKSFNVYEDLNPIRNAYKDYYDNPFKMGVASEIVDIIDIQEGLKNVQRVFIGELVSKNPRDMNETVFLKKRGGVVEDHHTRLTDLRIRDDSDMIGCRIGRYDWEQIGKELEERVPVGAHLLIRAVFYNGIRYAFIKKWKWLNEEEMNKLSKKGKSEDDVQVKE